MFSRLSLTALTISIFSIEPALANDLSVLHMDSYKEFSCAVIGEPLATTGMVKCWGRDTDGNLGLGIFETIGDDPNELSNYLRAINLGTGRSARKVAVGSAHACAILDNDALKCWGDNAFGQLGQEHENDIGDPPSPPLFEEEMGDELDPIDLGTNRTALDVVAGEFHTCAILDNYDLKCWGDNSSGQLGLPGVGNVGAQTDEMGDDLDPVNLGVGRTAVMLSAGDSYTCAVLDNGDLKCWGNNNYGQLGYGDTTDRGFGQNDMTNLNPVDLGNNLTIVSLSSNHRHNCVVVEDAIFDRHVKCWGYNNKGQLGLGHKNNWGDGGNEMGNSLPNVDIGAVYTPLDIVVGKEHSCVQTLSYDVLCWGENAAGTLGTGTTEDIGDEGGEMGNALVAADLPNGYPLALVSGSHHMCVIMADEKLYCWGYNLYGQLGLGDKDSRGDAANEMANLPKTDFGSKFEKILQVEAETYGNCMILQDYDGKKFLKCWGTEAWGIQPFGNKWGDDANEVGHYLPAINLGKDRSPKQIAISQRSYCALLDNDTVKCWGENDYGLAGMGHTDDVGDDPGEMGDELDAIDLGVGRTAKQISVGEGFACARMDNGFTKCWGRNDFGQLGIGNKEHMGDQANELGDNQGPADPGTGRTFKHITSGNAFTCGLLDNDKIKCWGKNDLGQLGQGDTDHQGDNVVEMGNNLDYTELGTGRTAKTLDAGGSSVCTILDNDKVKCWGNNNVGQLGIETSGNNEGDAANEMGDDLEYAKLNNQAIAQIAVTFGHSCVVTKTTNKVFCWGKNFFGQLGVGSTNDHGHAANTMNANLPEVNLGNFTATKVYTGSQNSFALDGTDAKAWGFGGSGRLFKPDGDTSDVGRGANDMGNNLEVMEINFGIGE